MQTLCVLNIPPAVLARSSRSRWPRRENENRQTGFPARQNPVPVRASRFPVPAHREFVTNPLERHGNSGSSAAQEVRFAKISLYFPCLTGMRPQRPVDPRLSPLLGVRFGFAGTWSWRLRRGLQRGWPKRRVAGLLRPPPFDLLSRRRSRARSEMGPRCDRGCPATALD
jgi:hypothetical protein